MMQAPVGRQMARLPMYALTRGWVPRAGCQGRSDRMPGVLVD
jgi:hypothetical protein